MQFINNYFVLFYIGYLRQLKDPFLGVSEVCAGGSCLGQLQTQLAVVFTAKTFGLQPGGEREIGGPWGSREPPGPLLTHLNTVYMGFSEWLLTLLNPPG